ncbi:MAG: hypothetical protein EBR82_29720 [Caulobacteraceae bacterium]|nr:hypothetical protein [Caulobacteraceae bacterium]
MKNIVKTILKKFVNTIGKEVSAQNELLQTRRSAERGDLKIKEEWQRITQFLGRSNQESLSAYLVSAAARKNLLLITMITTLSCK